MTPSSHHMDDFGGCTYSTCTYGVLRTVQGQHRGGGLAAGRGDSADMTADIYILYVMIFSIHVEDESDVPRTLRRSLVGCVIRQSGNDCKRLAQERPLDFPSHTGMCVRVHQSGTGAHVSSQTSTAGGIYRSFVLILTSSFSLPLLHHTVRAHKSLLLSPC